MAQTSGWDASLGSCDMRCWARLRTCFSDYITQLDWEHYRISQVELENVSGQRTALQPAASVINRK